MKSLKRNVTFIFVFALLLLGLGIYKPSRMAGQTAPAAGNIETVAGNGSSGFSGDGGPANNAALNPLGVFVDRSGNIFFADSRNCRIREVVATTGIIQTTAATDGVDISGTAVCPTGFSGPQDVFVDRAGNVFIADQSSNVVLQVDAATGAIRTVAGNGQGACDLAPPPICSAPGDGGPATSAQVTPSAVYVDSSGNIYIGDDGKIIGVREVLAATGIIQSRAQLAGFSNPIAFVGGISLDGTGNIFIAVASTINGIFKVDSKTSQVIKVAGNGQGPGFSGDGGPATSASLRFPSGVFVDSIGNIFIADSENDRIREVDATTGIIQTVAGNGTEGFSGDGGPATNAELSRPRRVTGDRQGNLFFSDTGNNRIRRISGIVAMVGISVEPGMTTLSAGATQQFTASVSNAINTAVTWSLSGTSCSDIACGTISPEGLYTAPSTVNGSLAITVTATSVADDTKSATSMVTVQAKQATSLAVSSSANPSVLGQAVTFAATVSPASGSGTPTGTVTFTDGANAFGTVNLNGGQATLSFSSGAIGAHSITATYNGDSGFFGSNASLTQNVGYGICTLYDQTRAVVSGATFPIKLYLCDAGGNDVSSAALVPRATGVSSVSGFTGASASAGNANPDSNFRFDATLGPAGGYIFNLSTAGLSSGTYSLQFTVAGDPVAHAVLFGVR